MWTPDGEIGIVFNGEIYNHAELREELRAAGGQFVTNHSDTEVLLQGYRLWGDDFVNRLNGMWAFVIYDRPRRRLFASRDRFGKKPFYYTQRHGFFAFASELTALLAHRSVTTSISSMALRKFFAYGYIPAPNCIVEGSRKLPAGHCLDFDVATGQLRLWKYWDFVIEPFEEFPADAEERWCEELRFLFARAVKRRLVADVPIGAFLSGGIDSSAVAYFAARELGSARLHTYSIGFEEPTFDESAYAQRAADLVGSVHHAQKLSIDAARRIVPEVLSRLDEPLGDSSLLPTYLLCGFARQHVTVALGGDGGDELFAGYDPFLALRWADLYRKMVPRPLHRAISMLIARLPVSHRNMSLDFKLKRTLRGLDHTPNLWCPVWMAPLGPADLAECLGERVDLEEVYSEAIDQWDSCRSDALVDRTLQFYTKLYLQDDILTKVDRASMMHSLEVRAPVSRHRCSQFRPKDTLALQVARRPNKVPVEESTRTRSFPTTFCIVPKKGFGVPIGAWFKSGAVGLPHIDSAVLDPNRLSRRLDAHQRGDSDERAFLWGALTVSNFLK